MKDKPAPAFEETRRNVAGIDIAGHADHYVCGPRRDDGMPDIAHFGTTTAELHRMLAWLKERGVESVALESTSVYWIPVADLLEANGVEVVLVDTREVRMVPGRKSDVKDCQWLQRLHSCGLLRGGFRPPEDVAAVRTVLRERESLTGMRVQCLHQMQKSLDQMNVRVHHAVSDIDGKTGMAIIGAIVGGRRDPAVLAKLRDRRCEKSEAEIAAHLTGVWREEHLFNLGQAYRTLLFIDERLAEYDAKAAAMLRTLAEASGKPQPPSPPAGEERPRKDTRDAEGKRDLQRIMGFDMTRLPGIGYDTAAVVLCEIGPDFVRFPTERHFAAYIGLAPSLGKSAGKNVRQRKRCRNTSRAGRALRMAASSLYRSQTELGAFFRSVARRADRKTAVKATARRMAHLIYRAVRYGAAYVDNGAQAYEKRMRERALKAVRNLIKSHKINELELSTAFVAS
jgi:transposase